jgi:hypothetical protein
MVFVYKDISTRGDHERRRAWRHGCGMGFPYLCPSVVHFSFGGIIAGRCAQRTKKPRWGAGSFRRDAPVKRPCRVAGGKAALRPRASRRFAFKRTTGEPTGRAFLTRFSGLPFSLRFLRFLLFAFFGCGLPRGGRGSARRNNFTISAGRMTISAKRGRRDPTALILRRGADDRCHKKCRSNGNSREAKAPGACDVGGRENEPNCKGRREFRRRLERTRCHAGSTCRRKSSAWCC